MLLLVTAVRRGSLSNNILFWIFGAVRCVPDNRSAIDVMRGCGLLVLTFDFWFVVQKVGHNWSVALSIGRGLIRTIRYEKPHSAYQYLNNAGLLPFLTMQSPLPVNFTLMSACVEALGNILLPYVR